MRGTTGCCWQRAISRGGCSGAWSSGSMHWWRPGSRRAMTTAKSGRPGMGGEEVFFEMAEKKQLPDFCLWGGVELASAGARKGGLAEKVTETIHLEGSRVGDL